MTQAPAPAGYSTRTYPSLDFEGAMEHYTEAIELCPQEHATAAAPYYNNRAACQFKLVRWVGRGGWLSRSDAAALFVGPL